MEIVARSLNELTLEACRALLDAPAIQTRNGAARELLNAELVLTNPAARHLYLTGRKNNIYAALAEVFWVLGGSNELQPLMERVLPRSVDFSDDGKTWTNGYGPKLWADGNLDNVFHAFLTEGPNTRRACMAIWTPQTDSAESLHNRDIDHPKDVSCTNFIWFWIREDRLHMRVAMRSNDVLWGMSAVNVLEWTILQELVVGLLRSAAPAYEQLELGAYRHSAINLHVYDATARQANAVVHDHQEVNAVTARVIPRNLPICTGGLGHREAQAFFHDLLHHLSLCAQTGPANNFGIHIDSLFLDAGVPTSSNQLHAYAGLVELYLDAGHGVSTADRFKELIQRHSQSADLWAAVRHSHYTPDSWRVHL